MMGDTDLCLMERTCAPLRKQNHLQVKSFNAYSRRNGNHEISLLNLHQARCRGGLPRCFEVQIDAIRRFAKQPFIIGVGVLNEEYQQLSNGT